MSAASDAREALEAAVHQALGKAWRSAIACCSASLSGPGVPLGYPADGPETGRILAAADALASASVAEAIDDRARQRRLAAAEASAAEHRDRLAERPGRTG